MPPGGPPPDPPGGPPGGYAGPPGGYAGPPGGRPPKRVRARRVWGLVAVVTVIAVCAIAVIGVIGWRIGLDGLLVGLAAAIIPVPVLVLVFLWLDRYEPEPMGNLIACFGWGAAVATALALGVNTLADVVFRVVGLPGALVPVVVAPFIEELGKMAAPLLLLLFRRRAISGVTDGIVYCGLSATGFAMVENILYLGGVGYRAGLDEFGPATGLVMLIGIFLTRVFLSGFAHPLFTAVSGIGIGLAARTTSTAVRWLAPIGGVALAMVLHAT